MAKPNPEAKDCDIDGLIQDGTEFASPEHIHRSERNVKPKTPIITEDNTYPCLAAKNPAVGITRHE